MADRVHLAPHVPDLAALGASGLEDFLEGCRGLATGERAWHRLRSGGRSFVRVPLPGTPDSEGRRRELPRGAGTGWLQVHTWRSGPLELARERLRAPRSSSPAARRWNLACHLLAHGVGAPRPLALLERGAGLSTTSILVEAELERFEPLPRWLERRRGDAQRRRGLRALGLALSALFRCGAWLPHCEAADLLIAEDAPAGGWEGGESDCAVAALARLQGEQAGWRERGLRRAHLPAVAFAGLDEGQLCAAIPTRRRLRWLLALESTLPAASTLAPRERARVALPALAGRDRRGALAQLCRARATASASTAI